LTQNTAWNNVEKALANFGENLTPDSAAEMSLAGLEKIIRPSGFYSRKASCLKAVTAWFDRYNFDVSTVQSESLEKLRSELLAIKGIGPETADSILLYAFGFPVFVVDAYTSRLCERYPISAGKGYAAIKAYFEESLPLSAVIYNNFHALIVTNAKEHCRKTPKCAGCPLHEQCSRINLNKFI
jgi:endonuclease-3 related protein